MDRYSYIHGTLESGTSKSDAYVRMGGSKNLGAFLARIKAVNPTDVEARVLNILGGIQKLNGYDAVPSHDAPLAVRYAPMHLYKQPDMPNNMDAFCAMAISGQEQKIGRETVYSQVFFIDREEMRQGTEENDRKITYLDQLFGFEWLTARDMDGHRSGEYPVDFDTVPSSVTPVFRYQDKPLVLQTVRAIYDEKSVVIRLEENCDFNRRAKQLLTQIYSMMPPLLATEIGFASYQNPTEIVTLSRKTSIRIYLVPSGCQLPEFPSDSFVVFDLEHPGRNLDQVDDKMNKILEEWYGMPWKYRQEEMASLFADTVQNYMDKQIFLERSQSFQENEFFEWLDSGADNGSVTTLEQLFALYSRFPLLEKSPLARNLFQQRLPSLMKEPDILPQLTAMAAAKGLFGEEEEMERQQELYLFAADALNSADPLIVGGAVGYLVTQQERTEADRRVFEEKKNTEKALEEGNKRVAEEQQKAAAQLADAKAASDAAIAQEQERTRTAQQETLDAKADGDKRVAEEQQKAAAQLAAAAAAAAADLAQEQERTRTAQQEALDAKADGDKRVAEEQQKAAAELAAANAAAAAVLAQEQKNAADALAQEKQKAADALTQEQTRSAEERAKLTEQHTQELTAEKQRYDELHKKASAAYTAMRTRAEDAEKNLEEEKAKLKTAQQEHEKAIAEHQRAAKAAISKKQAEITARDNEIARLKDFLKVNPEEVEDLRGQLRREQELSRNLQREMDAQKRKGVIGIIVAFLVGALLCGGIIGILSLLNKDASTEGSGTTAATTPETTVTETTVPETTVVTLPPETEPPVLDWSSEAYIEMAKEAVDNLNTVQTHDYVLPEDSALNAYSFVAMLSSEIPSEEVAQPSEYLLLLEAAPAKTEEVTPEGDEPDSESHTEDKESQENTTEAAEFDITAEADASMALAWGDQLLVVYGDSEEQLMAFQMAAFCAQENEPVMLYVNPNGKLADISAVLAKLQVEDWKQSLSFVTNEKTTLQISQEDYAFGYDPAMHISTVAGEIYLFAYPASEDWAFNKLKSNAEINSWTVLETEHSLVIMVSAAVG